VKLQKGKVYRLTCELATGEQQGGEWSNLVNLFAWTQFPLKPDTGVGYAQFRGGCYGPNSGQFPNERINNDGKSRALNLSFVVAQASAP
jgi:hypothetical protein